MSANVVALNDTGRATAAGGTAFTALCPPRRGLKTRLNHLSYNCGTTAHTLTIMRELARTTVNAVAAAGQAVVQLTVDPGTLITPARILAAGDYLVFELPNQQGAPAFLVGVVSSVAASGSNLNVTLTANLPTGGIAKGAVCWMMGVAADLHPQYLMTVSVVNTISEALAGFVGAKLSYSPLLVYSNNATAAGTLQNASISYVSEGGAIPNTIVKAAEEGQEQPPEVVVYLLTPDEHKARTLLGECDDEDAEEGSGPNGEMRYAVNWPHPEKDGEFWPNGLEDPCYFEGEIGDPGEDEDAGGAAVPGEPVEEEDEDEDDEEEEGDEDDDGEEELKKKEGVRGKTKKSKMKK
jgi:hypothetical protein